MTSLRYRPDIDGLRTLAVVPVILFHGGASWMPGGFVGVDIFFVISGYLISAIILREVQADSFSFLRFYERRLRRIIPALLVMLLVTVAVFQIIALPDQALGAAKSGIAALLSVSNFWFWRESGYFAPTAEFMPLLHTWSLAVEEQFYLIFPVILLAIWRLRLPVRWVLVAGTVAAFGIGLWLSVNKPSVAYYLLPARAWELAIGAVLASGAIPGLRAERALLCELVPAAGIGLILFSLFWIRSDMIFPGWVALIPCLGAALIIHAGGQSWVARHILAARPMVFVGLLSYSLYLWHWPVLAALRILTADVHLDLQVAAGAVALTFLLAWLSWYFVERPFRDKRSMAGGKMLALVGAGSAAVLGIAGLSIMMAGFPARLSDPARIALAAAQDIDPLRNSCMGVHDQSVCRFGAVDLPVTYAIIGDSHAAAIRPAVEASGLLEGEAGTLYWSSACPLLDGAELTTHPERANCNEFKTAIFSMIEASPDLKTIILASRWPYMMTGWTPQNAYRNEWIPLVDEQTEVASREENARVLARSLERTIDRLSEVGLNIVIVGSVPEAEFDVPRTVALARQAGIELAPGIRRDAVEVRAGAADTLLAEVVRGRDDVKLISIWTAFCNDEWCDIERSGVPIYFDDDHLSYRGAIDLAGPAIHAGN